MSQCTDILIICRKGVRWQTIWTKKTFMLKRYSSSCDCNSDRWKWRKWPKWLHRLSWAFLSLLLRRLPIQAHWENHRRKPLKYCGGIHNWSVRRRNIKKSDDQGKTCGGWKQVVPQQQKREITISFDIKWQRWNLGNKYNSLYGHAFKGSWKTIWYLLSVPRCVQRVLKMKTRSIFCNCTAN